MHKFLDLLEITATSNNVKTDSQTCSLEPMVNNFLLSDILKLKIVNFSVACSMLVFT